MKSKSNIFMYITLGILLCLNASALQSIKPPAKSLQYMPITNYKNTLSAMLNRFIAQYIYKSDQINKPITIAQKNSPILSRTEALEKIKEATTKLFDPLNCDHISVSLNVMNNLCKSLDPVLDKKTIDAIHFLVENQHRSSYIHTLFWIKAIKEKELHTAIPMTPEVAQKTNTEKLMAIRQKMLSTTPKE